MTQHQPSTEEKILGEVEKQNSESNLIPLSILVAAILVCASIFYNTSLLIKKLDGSYGSVAKGTGTQAGVGNQVPPTPSPTPQGPVTVKEAKYIDTGKLKLVYRHYPLAFHQNAQKAGEAAECASRQGKFTEMHDIIFNNSTADGASIAVPNLKGYASKIGLNAAKFNSCLDNGETSAVVASDMADGSAAGVTGTPGFFLNGQLIVGAQPFAVFEKAIEAELSK